MDMKSAYLISADFRTVTFLGLQSLLDFIGCQPGKLDGFVRELVLDRDLQARPGTVIIPAGSELTREHLARLVKLQQSRPDLELTFTILVTPALIDHCRADISRRLRSLLSVRSRSDDYRALFKGFEGRLTEILDLALANDKAVLVLCRSIHHCRNTKQPGAARYLDFTFESALFSMAIAAAEEFQSVVGDRTQRLAENAVTALFHNYGGLAGCDEVLLLPEKERLASYQNRIGEKLPEIGRFELGSRISDAVNHLCAYLRHEKDFLDRKDWPSIAAGIVLTAVDFLQHESGLFGQPKPIRLATDLLNARAFGGWLAETPVRALSRLLGLQEIFDFYEQMETLTSECPYHSAAAYPLTGFKSPTIFICRHTVRECEFLEGSHSAVNLVKVQGDLPPGKYHRCNLLTPKLLAYYDRHYEEIKDKKK